MQQRLSKLNRPTFFIFLFFSLLLTQGFAPSAWAARVLKSKNKTVLIDLEGDTASVGDRFFVMIDGKKRGLVTLTKIKNGRALATLNKGVVKVDAQLSLAKANDGSSQTASSSKKSRRRRSEMQGLTVGALLGYVQDSQTANVTSKNSSTGNVVTQSVSMSGSGFSLKGFGNLPLSKNFGLAGRLGFETFKVSGTSNGTNANGGTGLCTGSNPTNCLTNVTYLTIDALVNYQFPLKGWTPFVELGLGIYYPLSKSTTAVNPNITATTVFEFGVGANIKLNHNAFIPIVLEYGLFPPSSSVKTNDLAIRAGYGLLF
jgi:hypothetical protein